MDYQLINKYLQNEASEAEIAKIFQWINDSSENRKEFIDYKKVWALTAEGNEDKSKIWNDLFANRLTKVNRANHYLQIFRYAAVILLMFGAGITIQYLGFGFDTNSLVYHKETSIVAPAGQTTNVELPDGTKVMLNSGSSLTYSGNFSKGERSVNLVGEAYFDVTKDKKHPFLIETASIDFKVYGTSFNIEAYPDENKVSTTLIEGSLGVITKSDRELVILKPGENAHFDIQNSRISVSKVNTEIYTSWKNGLITFRNEKLSDIALKIERWYNVKIVINNQKLREEAYLGTIMKNKPIDQILEALKLSSSLNYKIVNSPDQPTLIYWY